MTLPGGYVPSPRDFVRDQVGLYERSKGQLGNTRGGYPVVIMTSRGSKTAALRKTPLIRVENNGEYAAVASFGGAARNPAWYFNLITTPVVELQDGPIVHECSVRELHGSDLEKWWVRAVAVFPPYAEYRATAPREIPVFLLTPLSHR